MLGRNRTTRPGEGGRLLRGTVTGDILKIWAGEREPLAYFEGTFSGVDQITGFPTTWALGYFIGHIGTEAQETPTVFGWGGVGGSYAYADTATGVALALTKNRLTPSFDAAERVARIVTEAIDGVGDARTRSDEPESDLPTGLSKPARRALVVAGYTRLEQLTEVSEAEVMKLHGMGPKALDRLRRALAARDQRFAGS